MFYASWGQRPKTLLLFLVANENERGGDQTHQKCPGRSLKVHFLQSECRKVAVSEICPPPCRDLSLTRRSANRSASEASSGSKMSPSSRRASTVICTSPWWKTGTLPRRGITISRWLTRCGITWWGDGSGRNSSTTKQIPRYCEVQLSAVNLKVNSRAGSSDSHWNRRKSWLQLNGWYLCTVCKVMNVDFCTQ